MLQCKKIDVSEGIDNNKTRAAKECMLCHYWYFKDVGFKFEPHVCNKCHDVLMTAYELKNIAILVQVRRLLKRLEEAHLEVLILKTFILVLLKRDTKCHGNNSIS